MRFLINSANAGEVTPLMLGRVDLPNVAKACRILENFTPYVFGAFTRRPGTLDLGATKDQTKKARLIPFKFSATTRYQIELGHLYARFWRGGNGTQVESGGSPVEVVTPWTEDEIFEVNFTSINDVMFFTHPSHPPQQLTRVTDTSWTLTEFAYEWPPMGDENLEATTLTPSATTGAGITVTASAAAFTADHVGAFFEISHYRASSITTLSLATPADSASMAILGKLEVTTYGSWTGTLSLQRKNAAGSWENLLQWASVADKNVVAEYAANDTTEFRLSYSGTGTSSPRAELRAADGRVTGLVKVTAFTDSTHVTATVVKDLLSTGATPRWAEGAWSVKNGYPRALTLHQQRLVFAATTAKPQQIWASAVADFNNFSTRTNYDADAWSYQIAAEESTPIQWLASSTALVIGTGAEEWIATGDADKGSTLTPTSRQFDRKSKTGSEPVQAQVVGGILLFVQRSGRRLREFVYLNENDRFDTPDVTQLADHMTRGGFRQFAYAQNPDSILWAVTGDGKLISCTYKRSEEVVAWSRHPISGTVESVAVVPGDYGADEVWMISALEIDGSMTRRLRRFDPEHWDLLEAETTSRLVYLDGAIRTTLAGGDTDVTSLDHLEGETVSLLVDGAIFDAQEVVGGKIVLEARDGDRVVVAGLPYTSRYQPMPLEIQMQDGTAQGRKFKVDSVSVLLHKTGTFRIAPNPAKPAYPSSFRTAVDPYDAPPPLFTGEKNVSVAGGFDQNCDIVISASQPLPLTVVRVVPRFSIHGADS